MTTHLIFLTGSSRGMGLAMARQLLQPGHTLICLARSSNDTLAQAAAAAAAELQQWSVDLSAPAEAAARLGDWLAATIFSALCTGHADQQRRRHAGDCLSALSSADLSPALRVGLNADVAHGSLSRRDRELARTAQSAQYLFRPGPASHGRASGLLRKPKPVSTISRCVALEKASNPTVPSFARSRQA